MHAKALTVLRITLFDSSKKIQAHAVAPSPSPSRYLQREICKDAETCILSFFNSIFVHRYKDLHPEVRKY
jgi:hypothetical protein